MEHLPVDVSLHKDPNWQIIFQTSLPLSGFHLCELPNPTCFNMSWLQLQDRLKQFEALTCFNLHRHVMSSAHVLTLTWHCLSISLAPWRPISQATCARLDPSISSTCRKLEGTSFQARRWQAEISNGLLTASCWVISDFMTQSVGPMEYSIWMHLTILKRQVRPVPNWICLGRELQPCCSLSTPLLNTMRDLYSGFLLLLPKYRKEDWDAEPNCR